MSILLAKIFGIYFFTLGLSFLLSPQQFKKFDLFLKDDNAMLLGGIIGVLLGAAIISLHNIWMFGWPVIITILGWWSLIKGFGILTFPEFAGYFNFMSGKADHFYRMIGFIYLVLGLFIGYHGWF